MSLVSLAAGIHVFPGAVNSVVIENGHGQALLIDTGLDGSHARKLLRSLEEHQLIPSAILNTHSHADHHGGNAFILKKFPDLPVFAPPLEAAIIQHPILEPLYLFGALPMPELQTKFLLAPPSPAQGVAAGTQTLGGVTAQLLEIPGHAAQMYAVQVGDFLYAADGLFGSDALQKHPLTFCLDSAQQKASARQLSQLGGIKSVLPGHGGATPNIGALVEENLEVYEGTTTAVLSALRVGAGSIDDLLARVCKSLDLQMTAASALVLNRSVVSAHLTELLASGQADMQVEGNKLIFTAKT